MNHTTEQQLLEALEALEAGTPVPQILSRYPAEVAQELRPVLELTLQLEQRKLQPALWSRVQSKQKFLAAAQALKNRPVSNAFVSFWQRLLSLSPALALGTVLIIFGTGWFSQSALPGDTLYSTKRLLEYGQVWWQNDPAGVYALEAEHNQERIREVYLLLASQRMEGVIFEGLVEAINGELWTIEGLTVVVNEQTRLNNPPVGVQQMVRVEGQTAIGRVQALTITPLTAPVTVPPIIPTPTLAPVEPSATVQATPTITQTQPVLATPTNTLHPTVTATRPPAITITPTRQPTALPTATFAPSPTAVILPTATPLPPTNENGNEENSNEGNSNDDDNGNDDDDDNQSGNSNDDDDDNSGGGGDDDNDNN